MRRVLLENRKLVTKREDLCLQRATGSTTGGYQREKADEKRLIVVVTMISRMMGSSVFSDLTEFSIRKRSSPFDPLAFTVRVHRFP